MPYTPSPYVPQIYQPNNTGRLSDLIRQQGTITGNRMRNETAANALMVQAIGNQVGGVLSQLAQYKMDEPRRKAQEAEYKEAERQRQQAAQFRGLEQMAGAGKMSADDRAGLYEQEGFHAQAEGVRDGERKRQIDQYALTERQMNLTAKKLFDGVETLHQIQNIPDEAQRAQAYTAALPKLKGYAGENAQIPDAYDPKSVENMITIGATAAQKAQWQGQALQAAQLAGAEFGNQEKANAYGNAAMVSYLRTADTPEEWAAAQESIKNDKLIPEAIKKQYPTEFSPEAVAEIAQRANAINPDRTRTDLEMQLDAFQRTYHRLPNDEEMRKMRIDVARSHLQNFGMGTGASGRKGKLTDSQKAVIERWKANEYAKLEKRRVDESMGAEDLALAKEQIQAGYLAQLGIENGPTLADLVRSGVQPGPAVTAAPEGTNAAAAPPPQMQQAAAPQMPQSVTIRLSDGRTVTMPNQEAANRVLAADKQRASQGQQAAAPAAPAQPQSMPREEHEALFSDAQDLVPVKKGNSHGLAERRHLDQLAQQGWSLDTGRAASESPEEPAPTSLADAAKAWYLRNADPKGVEAARGLRDRVVQPTRQELSRAWQRFKRDFKP